jgi:hypothetical protein
VGFGSVTALTHLLHTLLQFRVCVPTATRYSSQFTSSLLEFLELIWNPSLLRLLDLLCPCVSSVFLCLFDLLVCLIYRTNFFCRGSYGSTTKNSPASTVLVSDVSVLPLICASTSRLPTKFHTHCRGNTTSEMFLSKYVNIHNSP